MNAETAAKPTTLSAKVTPGPRASREMNGPRSTTSVAMYCSGSREAINAPSSGAPAAKAQTRWKPPPCCRRTPIGGPRVSPVQIASP